MDAKTLNKQLEEKASELNEATDIPSVDVTIPELKMELIDLTFCHVNQGQRIKALENSVFALTTLILALFFVVWTLKVQINVEHFR